MAKIIILGPAHPIRGGGMSTFNERLARELMNEGHQVSIYTFSLQYPALLFPGKTQLSDEPPPNDLDIKVKLNSINPINWWKTGREIRKLAPDVLLIRYWIPFMAPCLGKIAAIVRKNKHTEVIAITDNIIPHEKRPGDGCLTRYFLKRIDRFIVMSEIVMNDLKKFRTKSERITLCLHPLYDNFGQAIDKKEARTYLKINAEENIVLFFGFIRDYKGLDLLIKAMANEKVRRLKIILLVAGEFYSKPDPYFRLVEKLNLNDSVIWHNQFIANDLVRYYFSAADLVAQPYKSATQSGVTQVAYHFEKPMLVTKVGGLPEMVPHGKVGYVVDPDPDEIAKALIDFFTTGKRQLFSEGLKVEKKRFSWKNFVDAIIQ